MLLIPLSKKASRGDQIENANYFKQNSWANVMDEKNLNPENLIKSIKKSLNLAKISMQNTDFSKSNENIVNIILQHCK